MRVSYMEIYNEEVRDLLIRNLDPRQPQHSLEIKERKDIGIYIKDLLSVTVASPEQCLKILKFGNANRRH